MPDSWWDSCCCCCHLCCTLPALPSPATSSTSTPSSTCRSKLPLICLLISNFPNFALSWAWCFLVRTAEVWTLTSQINTVHINILISHERVQSCNLTIYIGNYSIKEWLQIYRSVCNLLQFSWFEIHQYKKENTVLIRVGLQTSDFKC